LPESDLPVAGHHQPVAMSDSQNGCSVHWIHVSRGGMPGGTQERAVYPLFAS
jgi:hypothetical protein